ncbi:MAG TPA: RNA methyltransferase [Chitinophagales bacterium]|nr:RNA methyltransferase [Chitinophagales bacterium]HMW13478.1 RNA methyltransferase [Chitinophagales bacterium]HMX60207.1 RNA methyltransferase [Chitinophagales bacterium]HMZ34321.1 RNA methyltransferase [Chitinophagales bacterium]HNA39204.1 RNA methyltransferase [Chitinophagales bacterium]
MKIIFHFCKVKEISSSANPLIKKIVHLQEKSRARKEENIFVIDGWKETKMALENGFSIETILCQQSAYHTSWSEEFKNTIAPLSYNIESIIVTDDVFDKISYRGNTSKVLAIAQQKSHQLSSIEKEKNPVFLILDGIEKPGNLGAILRIADAANITAIICCDTKTDIYNPNVIRSSVGCIFTQQIIICEKEAALQFLENNKVNIFTTSLKAAQNYLHCDYKQASAFVFGTEATGVDAFWENHSRQNIIIPMRGQNDSLNVSNTVAIVLFEALRQRG